MSSNSGTSGSRGASARRSSSGTSGTRRVDAPAERREGLVRRDVRRGLLAPDVLLAGREGEDIAAFARGVERLADDPARHAPNEVSACREEAVVRTAVGGEVARSLSLAD